MNNIGVAPLPGTKKWCFVSTRVFSEANGTELPDVPNRVPFPQGAIVELSGQQLQVNDILWSEVVYKYNEFSQANKMWEERTVTGWVNDLFLDDYNVEFPGFVLNIPNQTADPTDAQQYMVVEGYQRNNLCGEFCVALIITRDKNPDASILSILNDWRDAPKSLYTEVLAGEKEEKTTARHLKDILRVYGYSDGGDTDDGDIANLFSGVKGHSLARDGMKAMLKTHYLIALIKSNVKGSGELLSIDQGSGIDERNHWVVVERLTRNGNGIVLYNPFPNKWEEYSYTDFFASCTSAMLAGLWVKRKSSEVQKEADVEAPKFVGVHIDKPLHDKAEQYLFIKNGKKTELCGEFSVAYILSKSIDNILQRPEEQPPELPELVNILKAYGHYKEIKSFSMEGVLDYWNETQPKLHAYHVGQNKGTGTWQLKTILRAYGYNNPDDFMDFDDALRDGVAGQYLPSAGRMSRMLNTHFFIAGVAIDKTSGRLVGRSKLIRDHEHYTAHWVVVEKIEPVGKHYMAYHSGGSGGWVTLYNPFMNTEEGYSYREFTNALDETGAGWDGLWVKRKINPKFEKQQIEIPPVEVNAPAGNNPARKKEAVPRKLEKPVAELIQKKISNKVPPDTLIKDVVAFSGWDISEILNRPDVKKYLQALNEVVEAPVDDFEKTVQENLQIKSLPAEITILIRKSSKEDSALAVVMVKALLDSGVLTVGDNSEARIDESPQASRTIGGSFRKQTMGNFLRQSEMPEMGVELTLKVANVILPKVALCASQEIASIRAQK